MQDFIKKTLANFDKTQISQFQMNPANQNLPLLPFSKSSAYFMLLSFLQSENLSTSLLSQLKDFVISHVFFNKFPRFFFFFLRSMRNIA